MKKLLFCMVFAASCSTTRSAAVDDGSRVAALEEMIAEKQAVIDQYEAADKKGGKSVSPAMSNAAIARAESFRAPGYAQNPMVAPRCMPSNRPVVYAWLYHDPEGCRRTSPFSLELWNSHDEIDVRVMLDGKEVVVLGAGGPLCAQAADISVFTPIPHREHAWLCIDKGTHSISMTFYAKKRYGMRDVLTELKRKTVQVDFNRRNGPEMFEISSFHSY